MQVPDYMMENKTSWNIDVIKTKISETHYSILIYHCIM